MDNVDIILNKVHLALFMENLWHLFPLFIPSI